MILTCPACSTRYQVDEAKFPSQGRTVRCAKCSHSWHQPGPAPVADAEVETVPEPEPVPEPAFATPAPNFATGTRSFAPQSHVAERERGSALQTAAVMAGWAGLVAIVLLIGVSAVRYRQDITAIWPQSAGVYSGLGLKVNANGIDFHDVSYKRESEDGQSVLSVTGTIVNASGRELPVPQTVRVTLSDSDNHELYHWSFKPSVGSLKAGGAVPFRTRLSSPPAAARHLEVRFAKDGS